MCYGQNMKIEQMPHDPSGMDIFKVSFELNEDNGIHESYVALNAIAARNRQAFEASGLSNPDTALVEATKDFLTSGIDKFAWLINRAAREKSREGLLTEDIVAKGTIPNLQYLHDSLIEYRRDTSHAVVTELSNTMGNIAGLARTNEGITADSMVHCIETAVSVESIPKPQKAPLGFGRVLIQDVDA